jgi:predicted kinase
MSPSSALPASGPARTARLLRALRPSCGPVRLVGLDGHAGSGKTTWAARLARELDGAPVLHLDDLARHDCLFGWTDRLEEQVLEPLRRGAPGRYTVYDWDRRRDAGTAVLPPEPVVLVEGVGAGRRELRPWLACLLWMDVPEAVAWERGRRRDGPAQAAFWRGWTRAERAHFSADPSRPHAHLLVRESDEGPVVLPGAGGAPGNSLYLTERHDIPGRGNGAVAGGDGNA